MSERVIIHDVQQGSSQWFAIRCGLATASRFADIITPTGKPTNNAARKRYVAELVRERLTGDTADHFTTPAMERGTKLEPRARSWYEVETGREVRTVGFVTNTAFPGIGGSPDFLCADRGGEIKIPVLENLIGLYIAGDEAEDYMMQIQGNIWLCELPVWDLVLFSDDPAIPSRIIEVPADPKLQAALAEHVPAFVREVCAAEKKLIELGGKKRAPHVAAPDEQWDAASRVEPQKEVNLWKGIGNGNNHDTAE